MKSPKLKFLLGLTFFLGYLQVYSQGIKKIRYLTLGMGTTSQLLQDPAVSPMLYQGSPFTFYLGFEKRKGHSRSQLSLTTDLGKLQSRNATELRPMSSSFYRIDIDYSYLRLLKPGKFNWFLGGHFRSHNSIRLTPQNDTGFISFLIGNGLGISVRGETDVMLLGRTVNISWQGDVPLFTHIIRPSYLNIYNYIDPEHDWLEERLEASRFVTLNQFPAISSNFQLNYPIRGENQLRLAYQWNFYHLNAAHSVNSGRHSFTIGLLINI